ncbi:extracellular solute-binding protein [Streptomyces sp. NA04227]|uniref:ABC transporter substrate-binding protein n=1 Tax=Streptomyces sp. NA04227 TaxID=2742136 RepID=UPI0015914490|nr:extracellular solute-binding protein [Streptomyces sp. NA04227]QKW10900.1 extracellular solute-binding protein [Streptomyces sp. NA04227]
MAFGLGACGEDEAAPRRVAPAVAGSAEEAGGMDALIRAAKKEGHLNAIALLPHWANYDALFSGFEKKYGIEVTVARPYAHSQNEIEDVKKYRGRDHAPDVLQLGDSFARSAAEQGLLDPYRVQDWDKIPRNQKDPQAHWYNNYGGYISIGCDVGRVKRCPVSFADLLKPEYEGKVALNGKPTVAGQALASVFAAALTNGGSTDDIQPGVDFFAELARAGNYNRGNPNPASIARGRTPIAIGWDYLNLSYARQLRRMGVKWEVSIPFDASFTQYYAQAINKHAPHPAAARLWEEYLFSPEGQNLRLVDYARPVLMDAMAEDGTLDKFLAARLPTVEGATAFPTPEQLDKALRLVRKTWGNAVGD